LRPFDANGALQQVVPSEGAGLRRVAVRGVAATLLSGGTGLGIQIVSAAVMARLLTPKDFGLVTMVTTFSLLFMNFGLNGFTEAVCHREDIDHQLASNLFWINVLGSSVLTIGFAAAGRLLARLFGDARVAQVTVWMSLTIFLTGLAVIHLSLLKRVMRFSVVSANDMFARAVSVLVAIGLGWAGWGYWALVAGAIALSASTCIGAWILCRWTPGLPRRAAGTGSLVKYALHTYGRFTTGYFTNNLDNFLVGWKLGPTPLGFYKKAYDLFGIPSNQLSSGLTVVAVSALSRLQRDPPQYRRYLLSALGVMAFIGMGISGDLTLVGKDLILLLLGPKWGESGRLFTIFAPGIGFMLLYFTHVWIHLSLGKADRWLRWGMVDLVVTTVFLFIGLHWEAPGIAAAWVASYWVIALPALWYAGKPIELEISSVIAVIWRYIVASIAAGGASFLLLGTNPSLMTSPGLFGVISRLVLVSLLFVGLYAGAVVMLHGSFAPLYQVVGLLREMTSKGERSKAVVEPDEVNGTAGLRNWVAKNRESRIARKSLKESFVFANTERPRVTPEQFISRLPDPRIHVSVPLVSILIPAYNAQEWIADTIRSATAQTWPRKEIIVVDDGSSDRTVEIARQFEPDGVRVVTQQNQGAAAARNTAHSLSQGDFIQWLDADDLLAPDKIALQMEEMGRNSSKLTLLSGEWGRFMYRPWRAKFTPSALWCDLTPVEWLHRKMEQNIYMQTATWLVSRELTEAAGPWDTRLLGDDDGEYFCRVLMASDGVRFVPDAKVYYRSFGYNSLGYVGLSLRKCEAHWLSMQLHIKYLRELDDSARSRAACLRYLRSCLIYFYPEKSDIVTEAQEIAKELGEPLGEPSLSWKYSWVKTAFGWGMSKRMQVSLRKVRWQVAGEWDKAISQMETRLSLAMAGADTPGARVVKVTEPAQR
jgi:O-antigen/teichoic acid export membrane protein/glycosyltransferase involved in cell wall biosynthesis